MREIPLTQGRVALVDDSDYESVSAIKWHAVCRGRRWYAAVRSRGLSTYMHRMIAADRLRGRLEVDHINGDGLDNRRCNLRVATRSQNSVNAGARTTSKSGAVGVHAVVRDGRTWWAYQVTKDGRVYGSLRKTRQGAIEGRNALAKKLHGDFAREAGV